MARGKPQLWSALLGLPFVGMSGWLYTSQTEYPPVVGLPFFAFGCFIILVGLYVHLVAPNPPRLGEGEEIVAERHPTNRVALVKVSVGLPLLVATVYFLFFTYVPYVYPTVSLVAGLFLFSRGLQMYWANSLTTYYVTTNRVIKEYRLLSLIRKEIPRTKIRGVQERKTVTESLVGLGNVLVASGDGRSLEIAMQNIEGSDTFAESIRELI